MKLRGSHAVALAVLLVVAGGFFAFSGCPGPEENIVRQFEKEPEISVYITQTGQKKTMPIEEYIAGVVAGEMKENWPVEAYAAQAILARSFTMEFMSRGGTRAETGTDISTDVEKAQAYNPANITDAIRKAVQMTRGKVMAYNNRYVKAWFHSYSGGRTATPEEGLGLSDERVPYIRSAEMPTNPYVPDDLKLWRAEYTLDELRRLLADKGVNQAISDIRISKKGPTGRITEVEVKTQDGATKRFSGTDFRLALDPFKMKSTLVRKFDVSDGKLVMEGSGFGHGVGLSQWDAYMFAKRGLKPEEIIDKFFKGVEIRKLWD